MKPNSFRLGFVFLTVALLALGAACTDFSKFSNVPVAVSVRVTDTAGNPLEQIEVTLDGPETFGPEVTRLDGTIVFELVQRGNYHVVVRYPDGLEDIRTAPVWGGQDLTLAFERGAFSVATRVDDDFSLGFDTGVWSTYDNIDYSKVDGVGDDASPVSVREGRLVFENFHTDGWSRNQGGVVLKEAVDLTGATTVLEVVYTELNWTELNPGFFDAYVTDDEDVFDLNGFRLTVEPGRVDTRISHGGDGAYDPGFNTSLPATPFTLRWVLIHEQGQDFTVKVYVDNDLKHEGGLHIGTMNPEELYFYLSVANNNDTGPASVDRILLYQVYQD